jgi:hypothetical protein
MATYTKTYAVTTPGIRVDSDADFRDQGLFISDSLTSAGFLKTADTGQVDWATVTRNVVANTSSGYEVRVTNDAFTDVYVRIDYGIGYTNGPCLGFWLTMGYGTDGAGRILGSPSNTTMGIPTLCSNGASGYSSNVAGRIFVSATASRFTIMQQEDINKDYGLAFGFQRETDGTGADIEGDAALFSVWNYQQTWGVNRTGITSTGHGEVILSPHVGQLHHTYAPSILRVARVKRDASHNPQFQCYANGSSRFWPYRDVVVLRGGEVTWQNSQALTVLGSSITYMPVFQSSAAGYFPYTPPEAFTWMMRYD